MTVSSSLLDLKELDVEDKLRVGGDAGQSLLSVCKSGRDGDATLTTDSHAGDTDVPTLDDLTLSELEGERLALLVGVKDLAVLEFADVAHGNDVTALSSNTLSELLVVDLDSTDLLDAEGAGGLVTGGGGALLEVLGELDLFVGLGLLLILLFSVLLDLLRLNSSSIAVVLLELLLLGLGQGRLLSLGSLGLAGLGHQIVEAGFLLSSALVLALLGLNKLGGFLLAFNLSDSGVLHIIKVIALITILHGHELIHIELILIRREVVVIFILVIVVMVVVMVVTLVETNDVVTGQEHSVVSSDLEENGLALADSDIQSLLVVL